jgi:hypothetical protein
MKRVRDKESQISNELSKAKKVMILNLNSGIS